jgi:hypothetical protein
LSSARVGEESLLFIALPNAEVVLMGEADVRDPVGCVLAVLRDAGRAEGTVRSHRAVLDRFAAFLAGRGLEAASDRVCVEFVAEQTGSGWGRCESRSKTGVCGRFVGRSC